jgi:CheY-like chemotaxis protein
MINAGHGDRLPQVPVLIVEDQQRAARQLAELLRLWGAGDCTIVANPQAARQHLEANPVPGIVILDYQLHGETSVGFALWLAARTALRQQRVVVTYTSASLSTIQATLRSSLERLLVDSAFASDLLGEVAQHPWQERWLQPIAADGVEPHLAGFTNELYDAYFAKSTPLETLRTALCALCARFWPAP